jgi:tetratricopeptide (TPR) repeat protein
VSAWAGLTLWLLAQAAAPQGELEQAEALLWSGKTAEAEHRLEALVSAQPENATAHLRLAQARRWSGRPTAGLVAAERAQALAPERADVREEVAWCLLDLGRPAAAERALGEGAKAAPEALRERLSGLNKVRVASGATAFDDSNGVTRLAPRLSVDFPVGGDVRVQVGGGTTHLRQGATALDWTVGSVALSAPVGRSALRAGLSFHQGRDTLLTAAHVGFDQRLWDRLGLRLLARRRPLLEPPDVLATNEDAFHAAQAGGALDLARVARRGVDEFSIAAASAPLPGAYLYADARGFLISDANRGWSVAAGGGYDVLAPTQSALSLTMRWDSFLGGFAQTRWSYFTAPWLDSHSPGAEFKLTLQRFWAAAEGGGVFAISSPHLTGAFSGWFAGGGLGATLGSVRVSGRAQARVDPWFNTRRAWLQVEVPL